MPAKSKSKKETETEGEEIETLQEALQDIKTKEGIIGYILRGSNSASVDLKDPTKIVDYAILSATAFETGQDIANTSEIGKVNTIIMEGKDMKILSMIIDDNRLSIFMEKNVDHEKLREDLNQK
jgi:predicted regulator of Ras-like GTPase activity (Roadblock/LC7/MglB family)